MSPRAAAPETPEPETPDTPEKRALRVERIKKFVQLSASPGAEGTMAAQRACALIRKFDLDIVDPVLVDHLHHEIHQLRAQLTAAKAGEESDAFASFGIPHHAHHVHHTASHVSTQNLHTYSPIPPWPPGTVGPQPSPPGNSAGPFSHSGPQPSPSPQAPPAPATPQPVYVAVSKFKGRCKQCSREHDAGVPVLWLKGVGIWCPHNSCYDDWAQKRSSAASFNPFP